ncbi:MAG TPA: GldG family protein [Burkholderiales bacterium]|nr:GldG family protein [Burkholderiales bacterium]
MSAIAWLGGWTVAVAVLFLAGLRLPLQTRLTRGQALLYNAGLVIAGVAVAVLANVALILHDVHVDLTRERVFTPSSQAMAVVDELQQPVRVTYFYSGQDPNGRRTKEVLDVMGRRNALLEVRNIDPDRQPSIAQAYGVRTSNAAILEADGRKVLVRSTDESEIAIGIQRVLREKSVTACFLEGHNEFPMDNFEFHTHLEGIAGHSHDDASSKLIQTTSHGIGRLRRALEAQGYDTQKVILATSAGVPDSCQVLIVANPRTTFLPAESTALEAYLQRGGALLAMFDLGFVLEPRLAALVAKLGVRLPQEAVVDPLSHYSTDAEMVAVTAYDPNPMTRSVSMTIFPGIRPLAMEPATPGVKLVKLFSSSRDSYTRAVQPVGVREVEGGSPAEHSRDAETGPRVLAVAVEGRLPGASEQGPAFRAVIVGDGDFASNSFLPYLANGDLALSMVRWLVREEHLTTVASRIPVPPMVLLSSTQTKTTFLAVEVGLPLVVIAIGGMVWWRRR